jgi:thymidylate synthase ThyX
MPKNETLTPVTFPMELRFGEEPTTEFKNDLDALKVVLLDFPDRRRALEMVYQFVNATWEDGPGEHNPVDQSDRELSKTLTLALQGKALPTVLETLDFTFRIEGIDLQTVTHLIRHRTGSFSAQCTGDRWQTHSAALVPGAVQNSPELCERWQRHVLEAKKLYCDMIDTKKISIMDARTILPRCIETHYYVRFNLKDALAFIYQRLDRAIQPAVDNLMAMQMTLAIARQFPEILSVIDFDAPSKHFIATARTGKATNLYQPETHNDKFDWHPSDFIYQAQRDELNGTGGSREEFRFSILKKECDGRLTQLRQDFKNWMDGTRLYW